MWAWVVMLVLRADGIISWSVAGLLAPIILPCVLLQLSIIGIQVFSTCKYRRCCSAKMSRDGKAGLVVSVFVLAAALFASACGDGWLGLPYRVCTAPMWLPAAAYSGFRVVELCRNVNCGRRRRR